MSSTDEHLAARRILAITEEELQRIILDIHDGPVQKLFAALSQVNVLEARARHGAVPQELLLPLLNRISSLLECLLGHELVLEGLRGLLADETDIEVVATAKDGASLLRALEGQRPDVVLMDLQMPAPDGLNCLAEIRRRELPVRVLVLTAFGDGESIQFGLENGADGFALKTAPLRQTIEAIRQAGHGNMVFPPAARKWLLGHHPEANFDLSAREWDVLALAAEGLTNPEIAEKPDSTFAGAPPARVDDL